MKKMLDQRKIGAKQENHKKKEENNIKVFKEIK